MRRLEVTPLQSSPVRAETAIEGAGRVRRLTFEFSVLAAATGDFALPLTLLSSMALGAPLHVDSPTDPRLLAEQERIQARLVDWDSRFAPIPVDAPERRPPSRVADGVGAFFSGGVDSFYTVLTHQAEITHLILIHGFDYRPTDRDLRERVSRMTRSVASALGFEVIEVATDAKQTMLPLVPWGWYHGSLLAGIAQALEHHVSRVLIPGTYPPREQIAWGQHPELDRLWSTARVGIETADVKTTRPEKCEVVGESEFAMRWLRVCWRDPGEWNCGRCLKCLRTMIDLAACGRLADCQTFPDSVDTDAVRALVIDQEGTRMLSRTSIEAVRGSDADDELADALEFALRRSRYRTARKRLTQAPVGAVRRTRHELEKLRMRRGRPTAG